MKILFFPGSLGTGGAQAQAKLLALGLARRGHEVALLTLFPEGKFWDELMAGGEVRPQALFAAARAPGASAGGGLRRRVRSLRALTAAPGALRELALEDSPDVVLSSLYVSNLLAALAWPGKDPPLVWSVRGSDVPLTNGRRLYVEASRRLSRRPRKVIYNSFAGRDWHVERGFPRESARVVINGIDTEAFRKDPVRGRELRRRWKVGDGETLVGLVGRLSPMKDHDTFLKALAALDGPPNTRFVCVGGGPERFAARLRDKARELELGNRLIWAGEVREMPEVYNALDILVSSSAHGEGFSNVLAEGMACELSVVATDCGDARRLLGEWGRLVPRRQPNELARAVREVLSEGEEARGLRGRQGRRHVVQSYSIEAMVAATEGVLEEVTTGSTVGGP